MMIRHKAYVQLHYVADILIFLHIFNFPRIECDDSQYFSGRCIDIASNCLTSRLANQKSRFLGPGTAKGRRKIDINTDLIKLEDDGTFSVPSETKSDIWYSVSMELRTCSCPHGRLKGPCKHRAIVSISQHLPSFDLVPEDNPEMRRMWMFIGTGKYVDLDYFLPLSDPKNTDQTNSNATNQTLQTLLERKKTLSTTSCRGPRRSRRRTSMTSWMLSTMSEEQRKNTIEKESFYLFFHS